MGELAHARDRSDRRFLEGVIDFLSRRLAAALVTLALATIVIFAIGVLRTRRRADGPHVSPQWVKEFREGKH